MENNTVKTLLPLIKNKSYMEINEIVREWVNSRTNEGEDRIFKYASLAGVLEASITMLLDYINELEK
jgi:hypothetical protein